MMKRSPNNILRPRKLVVRSETVALLELPRLRHVVGGDIGFSGWPPKCITEDTVIGDG